MKDKSEKKDDFAPTEKARYEKPKLHNHGKLENLVSASDLPYGKQCGGADNYSAVGLGTCKP